MRTFAREIGTVARKIIIIKEKFQRFSVKADPGNSGILYLGKSNVTANDGTNEVQDIAVTGTPTGGDFTLTFRGITTAAIAYNAAASVVQTALEALSNISVGDVKATGGALPGSDVLIEFMGGYSSKDAIEMTADGTGLTGGTTPDAAITTSTPGVDGHNDGFPLAAGDKVDLDPIDELWVIGSADNQKVLGILS